MSVLFLLLPLALLVVSGSVAAFIWAVRHGQFDDLQTPPRRVLLEDYQTGLPSAVSQAEATRTSKQDVG